MPSLRGTHRDAEGRIYFEVIGELDALRAAAAAAAAAIGRRLTIEPAASRRGDTACENCGNVAGGSIPTVCPDCGLRDIAACPHCHREVSREDYEDVAGTLNRCPNCQSYVRLQFNNPLFNADGSFAEPVVLVRPAAGEVARAV